MNTNTIIGYRVMNLTNATFIDYNTAIGQNYETGVEPAPMAKADAHRQLAGYLDRFPNTHYDLVVEPVYYTPTPMDKAGEELGGLLESLCRRHGVDLGLTREQINAKLANELRAIKADGAVGLIAGLPKSR